MRSLILFFLCLSFFSISQAEYNYPIDDNLLASLSTTLLKSRLKKSPVKKYTIDSSFSIPSDQKAAIKKREAQTEVFIYTQKKKAPLVFLISGLGGKGNGGVSLWLSETLYQDGFNVITLPSTFFWKTALSSVRLNFDGLEIAAPGVSENDAQFILKMMTQSLAHAKDKFDMKITSTSLMGYSMGALQASFVSESVESNDIFNFKKIILINPPVRLDYGMKVLDRFWDAPFKFYQKKYSPEQVREKMFGIVFNTFTSNISPIKEKVKLNNSEKMLLSINKFKNGFLRKNKKVNRGLVGTMIGYSFRETIANVIATSQEFYDQGLLFTPRSKVSIQPRINESMISYGFQDYFKKTLSPLVLKSEFTTTGHILSENSIQALTHHFISSNDKFHVFHNEDDFLITQKDINYLKSNFGDRLTLYPKGGHLGNIWYEQNNKDLLKVLEPLKLQ